MSNASEPSPDAAKQSRPPEPSDGSPLEVTVADGYDEHFLRPEALEEQFYETERARTRRRYPWLLMLDTFRLAADPRKLVLAAVGILLLAALLAGLDRLPFATVPPDAEVATGVVVEDGETVAVVAISPKSALDRVLPFFDDSRLTVLGPSLDVNRPLADLFDRGRTWSRLADRLLRFLAGLIVWAIFGGAIARLAALRMTGDHPNSTGEAVRYSFGNLLRTIGGPVTPLAGLTMLWLLGALGGLAARIPVVGPFVAGALWVVMLTIGLFAAVVLIGVLIAWPLMVVTMAVEGTDGFDALSRGFGYLFGQPLYGLFLLTLLLIIGAAGSELAERFVRLVLFLADRFFVSGSGGAVFVAGDLPQAMRSFWDQAVHMLALAYPASYFWTATTAVYLLLRRATEGTPTKAIWLPPTPEPDDTLPLVGEPAAERREAEAAKGEEPSSETK